MHLHSTVPLLLSLFLLISSALAVYRDDAYQTDWHIPLIGPSLPPSTFFHRPSVDSKATLIYTLTERSILAAINPKDGEIVWRQALADGDGKLGVARGGEGIVVAGAGGRVEGFDAGSGKLAWENSFDGIVQDLVVTPNGQAVVLFASGTVRCLDGDSGDVAWEQAGGDGKDKASSLSLATNSVVLASLQAPKKLHLTTLSLADGTQQGSTSSVSSGAESTTDIQTSGAIVGWTENSMKSLKLLLVGSKASPTSISLPSDVVDVKIHSTANLAVVQYQSADKTWGDVYTINHEKGALSKSYTLDSKAGKSAIAVSSSPDTSYITWSLNTGETLLYRSDSPEVLATYQLSSNSLNADILHSISEVVARPDGKSYAVRTFLTSSVPGFVGDTHLIRNGEVAWTRNESLASVVDSTWVELLDPSTEEVAGELDVETHTNIAAAYVHRVKRHLHELTTYGPDWLQAIPQRVMSSFSNSAAGDDKTGKWRDFFGFRKLVVVVTEGGGIAALDVGHGGSIVWKSNILPKQGEWKGISGIYEIGKGVVGIMLTGGEFVQYDAFEGTMIGRESFDGTVWDTAFIENDSGKPVVLAILEHGGILHFPKEFDIGSKPVHLVTRSPTGAVNGIRLTGSKDPEVTWTFRAPKSEVITSLHTRPAHDPVASIGKVLGDRSVMYKYLNPNLMAITTIDESHSTATVHLLDSVSGQVLHSSSHAGVDTTKPISATLAQNWLVYSYFGDDDVVSESAAKGHYLVVSELYESEFKNDRGSLGSATNFSSFEAAKETPYVLSQAYIIPSGISALTTTSTKQGISSKEVLAILPSSGIVTIPKRVLDPRRPIGRDPSAAEMEEGLFRYAPTIEIDPRSIITHERNMMGLKKVVASPAELESTSLVFAYGGDLFGTRVAPSMTFDMLGKGFNKIQLVGTVVALAVGASFVAPMVRRKQINARWSAL